MSDKQYPIMVLQVGMTRIHGGIETYLMQQFRHLDKSRINYDFVNITAEYDIAFKDEITAAGSKIFGVVSRHLSPLKHYWQWLKIFWQTRGKYKAIILNTNTLSYVFPIFVAMFFKIPIRIVHSHSSDSAIKIGLMRRCLIAFNKILLAISATHYFACSEIAGKWLFDNKKFTIIKNAIDCNAFKYSIKRREKIRRTMSLENKFILGHVGLFSYPKNHEFLIEVFSVIVKKFPDAVLLLIGDTIEDHTFINKAKELVQKYNLIDHIYFLGARNDVVDLMQAMDIFLLPSRFEGLPLVGIEAQASGLPCCFSDKITRELKITNDLVQYVSIESIEAWVNAIDTARNIGRRDTSSEIAAAGYDINTEIIKLENFFEKEL